MCFPAFVRLAVVVGAEVLATQATDLSQIAVSPWKKLLAAVAEAGFEVVAIGSHATEATMRRTNLLDEFPVPLRVLGIHEDQEGWNQRRALRLLKTYLFALPSARIVFVLDLFDQVWLRCDTDLVSAFKRIGKPIVFGAELFHYPLTAEVIRAVGGYPTFGHAAFHRKNVTQEDGKRTRLQYRYLNSGLAFLRFIR